MRKVEELMWKAGQMRSESVHRLELRRILGGGDTTELG